jgi:hypothetical protein
LRERKPLLQRLFPLAQERLQASAACVLAG